MILDKIENLNKYNSIPNLDFIIDFIKGRDLSNLADGKIEIDGKKLFATVARYLPKLAEEKNFEVHELYVDVHIMIKGAEIVQFAEEGNLIEDKMSQEDYRLFSASDHISNMILKENYFVVFFPGELHKPGCRYQNSDEPVLKVIFKTA